MTPARDRLAGAYRDRPVLVTGCGGFLGYHLASALSGLGAVVTGVDSLEFAPYFSADAGSHVQWTFVRGDVTDATFMERLLGRADFEYVFHAAALASIAQCVQYPERAERVNVGSCRILVRAAPPRARVVLLSSAAVYGPPESLPITESHPRRGSDAYALTKIRAEDACLAAFQDRGRRGLVLRNFNSYGPRQNFSYVVPTLIRQALETGKIEVWNGSPVRDFLYVDDTIDAFLTVAAFSDQPVVNIGSGDGVTVRAVADRIAAAVGTDVPVKDLHKKVDGSPALIADVRALRQTGWVPTLPLADGIPRTVAWLRAQTAPAPR
jgi:UDP-glucose 4-epimerase